LSARPTGRCGPVEAEDRFAGAHPCSERTVGKSGLPSHSGWTILARHGPGYALDAASILVARTQAERHHSAGLGPQGNLTSGDERAARAGGADRPCRRACNCCHVRVLFACADIQRRITVPGQVVGKV
jgi:hypothetical protein